MEHDIVDYLRATLDREGSDLHIAAGSPPSARVHGEIVPLDEAPLNGDQTRELVYAVLNEAQRSRLEGDLELDFALQIKGVGRFRGNAHYTQSQVEAAFRHIPDAVPELEDLGHSDTVAELCRRQQGLILVTGITGSGKTTTLAAMAKRIVENRHGVLITIEDPIEYILPQGRCIVKQRQIGLDSRSFPNALRAALRQDPDVIFVSELRDFETIRTAITAAETGHLVIGTVHTIDAPKTMDRIVDVFPPDQQQQIATQIANCLVAVVSQRLLPRQDCAGRVMASEIMLSNSAIAAVIRDRRFEQLIGLIEIGRGDGMHTIDYSLAHLLIHGHISYEDTLAFCRDAEYINEKLKDHLREQERLAAAAKSRH